MCESGKGSGDGDSLICSTRVSSYNEILQMPEYVAEEREKAQIKGVRCQGAEEAEELLTALRKAC